MESTKEKTANSSKQSSEDVIEDKKNENHYPDVGCRKRKRYDAYKASFNSQRLRYESDGKSIENDDVEKKNGGDVSLSNGNVANSDNHMSHRSSYMIEHDLENQQELDTCHKVTKTCKAGGSMENSKFVEFWVPVPISNVQLEQYCATLLTNAMALRSSSKLDPLGTLKDIFLTNRKCCNHPYTVDPEVQQSLMKDKDQSMVVEVGTKASGKLHFLDHILPQLQKHKRKVLILFQHTSGSLSLGHILVDFVHRRFGQNSYQLVDGPPNTSSKKQAAINMFNTEITRFIFLLESRACHQSIKLSSVDAIIIFDSELNPLNDLKSMQKLSIDSQSEQIMLFRLYSLSTLEEKILKLPEINVTRDIRSQSLRTNYDALLMWGASDLFDKLTKFHSQTVVNISSDESFLKDVVEEFLYILSRKCKSNDTTSKSIITRVQNCGVYGKSNALHSEIKTRLPDGDQPYIFWRKLLEGRCPAWKFVSQSTPRQRKRPNYCLDSDSPPRRQSGVDGGDVATRKMTVYISTVEPARLKTVTEGETGRVNDESRSSSGNRFRSTAVNNETSLLDFLKPTVSELCNILKFSEDVKVVVETFLEFVVDHYKVSKEHTSILQAFMISLCWVGSSLAKNKIDRSESFALAKKHFDFSCDEEQAESVYKKLKQVKETFLERTQVRPAIKEHPEVAPTLPESLIEAQSHDERVCEGANDIQSAGSHTSEKETVDATVSSEQVGEVPAQQLDDDMAVDVAEKVDSSHAVEKLKRLEREFANRLEELEKLWENGLEEIKVTTLAALGQVAAENECSLRGSQSEVESADMRTPAGTCDKENIEDGEIYLDTSDDGDDHNQTSRNDVESAEVATPAVNEEKAEDNDSFCSDSGNPMCAALSQDKTPSVQTVSSPASDHSFQEIQNEPLELEPLPEGGVRDEEINVGNLQPSGASQLDQIIPGDELDIPSSTDPMVAENPPDALPPSGPLLEPTFEEPPVDDELDMFDKLINGMSPQMQDQTDPLQAEIEWLYTEKDNVTKFHQETKQKLDTECEKEIAETVAKIRLKYEAKHVEADAAYNSEKTELETNLNTVIMSRVLAEVFRCKCHNLIPSGDPSKDMEKLK
ncbi:putative DNA helicase [Helianthus annuus]|uniref:helicase protein MOM1 isoform X1 n=1 Tax=Helianthus annuus TaxID=4232 RepID=UPI000B901FDA|nr:helicase protein MOM1 isoform X1 [Helianthus annuus]XP_035830204.1 helicase protein MOM1 isoform X1 [Helianthus annuus]KAJ0627581.1 putative DNA helicase [Helianthus annuus]KAJ0948807.1 putative DNA helicase [Helianthus annuus]